MLRIFTNVPIYLIVEFRSCLQHFDSIRPTRATCCHNMTMTEHVFFVISDSLTVRIATVSIIWPASAPHLGCASILSSLEQINEAATKSMNSWHWNQNSTNYGFGITSFVRLKDNTGVVKTPKLSLFPTLIKLTFARHECVILIRHRN